MITRRHTSQIAITVRSIWLRLRRNIPLNTLLSIERWQLAYSRLCQINDVDRLLRFASLFHPTRSAIAGIDVSQQRLVDIKDYPPFVQMFVTILHQNPIIPEAYRLQPQIITDLAKVLNVAYDSGVNYDELAGALNSNLRILNDLLQYTLSEEQPVPDYAPNPTWRGWLGFITHDMHPRISEEYADWEVWALDELRYVLNHSEHVAIGDALAQLIYHLAGVENLLSVITVLSSIS